MVGVEVGGARVDIIRKTVCLCVVIRSWKMVLVIAAEKKEVSTIIGIVNRSH